MVLAGFLADFVASEFYIDLQRLQRFIVDVIVVMVRGSFSAQLPRKGQYVSSIATAGYRRNMATAWAFLH